MKLLTIVLLFFTSCQGPNPLRIKSERANLELAQLCARGWFEQLPSNAFDQKLVNDAFADWDKALLADEQLLFGGKN